MARILLLGGLDPSGGAGLTLDATVVKFLGADPLPVALATTVQGLRGFVRCAAIEDEILDEQVATVLGDGHVHAVKVGLVASPRQVAVVAELLRRQLGGVPIVVDPVLSATAGGMVANDELVAAYREHLVPLAALVTPNVPELEALAQGMFSLRVVMRKAQRRVTRCLRSLARCTTSNASGLRAVQCVARVAPSRVRSLLTSPTGAACSMRAHWPGIG
jgi:hydroxymethylpyrimidine/phosphomethylpyrimidine kinase